MVEEIRTPLKYRVDKLETLLRKQAEININLIQHLTEVKERLVLLEADAEEDQPKTNLILPPRLVS